MYYCSLSVLIHIIQVFKRERNVNGLLNYCVTTQLDINYLRHTKLYQTLQSYDTYRDLAKINSTNIKIIEGKCVTINAHLLI